MALVNLLKFNRNMGGIISDEEYWDVRFRRRLYCDNLYPLLDDKLVSRWGLNVVYGGVGYPSVHWEVINHSRRKLLQIGSTRKNKKDDGLSIRDIARIAFECLQEAIRRRIDQKLKMYFGMNTSELNKGLFTKDGKQYKIKNAKVKETARGFAVREKTDQLLHAAMDCKSAIFGYDPSDGITSYYLSVENSICGFNYEGFDSIGTGKYASGLSFGQTMNTKTLKMRREGFKPAEGIYELISSALLAGDHFKEVGGTMNFVIIDGEQKTPGKQYREIFDETARLAGEIVRASKVNLLGKEDAVNLIERLVLRQEPFDKVETEFFKTVKDVSQVQFFLRGYKAGELADISARINNLKTKKR